MPRQTVVIEGLLPLFLKSCDFQDFQCHKVVSQSVLQCRCEHLLISKKQAHCSVASALEQETVSAHSQSHKHHLLISLWRWRRLPLVVQLGVFAAERPLLLDAAHQYASGFGWRVWNMSLRWTRHKSWLRRCLLLLLASARSIGPIFARAWNGPAAVSQVVLRCAFPSSCLFRYL